MTDAPAKPELDIKNATTYLIMSRLRAVVTAEMERIGINLDPDRVLSCVQIRNELIRHEYNEGRGNGVKAEALYCEIGAKYGLAYKTVWHIVHYPER